MGRTHDIIISGFDLDRIESEARAYKKALKDILAALQEGNQKNISAAKNRAEILLQRLDSADANVGTGEN